MTPDTMTTTRTITALFDSRSDAMAAVTELGAAGIPRTAIRITPETDVTTSTTATSYDTGRDEKGFWASLGDLFIPDEDRHGYAEALHRGSIMVSVSTDAAHANKAEDILEQHGTVNVDEREESWRREGWSGYQAATSSGTSDASATATALADTSTKNTALGTRDMAGGDEVISEVEERLRVGKRQVNAGRVKVRSYVVETPVSEQVNLHSETVRVERRPVNRPMGATEDAFQERTIEAVAMSEEAVIAKEARVVGEVVVRKEATDRTETITDKVRSTKVEVEDGGIAGTAPVVDTTRRTV